jgi:hypothetical protein
MGSSDRLELRKEYKPGSRAFFGPMQKKSCFSVKIVGQENFSLKTTSVQVWACLKIEFRLVVAVAAMWSGRPLGQVRRRFLHHISAA